MKKLSVAVLALSCWSGMDLSVKDPWGAAGQVGLDYMVNDDWLINMSLWYIDTEVRFKAGGEQQNIKTRIDPWVFMFFAGYRF